MSTFPKDGARCLRAADVPVEGRSVRIASVREELIATLHDGSRLLLGATEREALMVITGSEYPSDWIGRTVVIYRDDRVGGIGVRAAPGALPPPFPHGLEFGRRDADELDWVEDDKEV